MEILSTNQKHIWFLKITTSCVFQFINLLSKNSKIIPSCNNPAPSANAIWNNLWIFLSMISFSQKGRFKWKRRSQLTSMIGVLWSNMAKLFWKVKLWLSIWRAPWEEEEQLNSFNCVTTEILLFLTSMQWQSSKTTKP